MKSKKVIVTPETFINSKKVIIQTSESNPKCSIYHKAIKIHTQQTNDPLHAAHVEGFHVEGFLYRGFFSVLAISISGRGNPSICQTYRGNDKHVEGFLYVEGLSYRGVLVVF